MIKEGGIYMEIYERLKELLEMRGWSIYKFAQVSGIPYSTLKQILQNKHNPSIDTLITICDALNMTLSQFLANDEEMIYVTPEQKEMLNKLLTLTKAQKELIRCNIDLFIEEKKK